MGRIVGKIYPDVMLVEVKDEKETSKSKVKNKGKDKDATATFEEAEIIEADAV